MTQKKNTSAHTPSVGMDFREITVDIRRANAISAEYMWQMSQKQTAFFIATCKRLLKQCYTEW